MRTVTRSPGMPRAGAPPVPGRSSTRTLPALLLPALAAFGLVLLLSAPDMVIQPDSVVYVAVAESVEDGRGLTVPFSHPNAGFRPAADPSGFRQAIAQFPPGLPVVLGIGADVLDPVSVSRLVNALCAAVAVAAVGWLVGALGGSRRVALGAQLFVVLSLWFLQLFTAVLTEAPFLAGAAVLAAVLVRGAGRAPTTREVAVVVGLLVAVSLFRYAAVGLTLGTAVVGLVRARRTGPAALRLCGAAAVSLVPLALWLVTRGAGVGNRVLALHPHVHRIGTAGAETVGRWLLPDSVPVRLLQVGGALGAAAVATVVVLGWRRAPVERRSALEGLALLVVSYLVVLSASQTFVDATISFDQRHLSVVFLLGVPLVAAAGHHLASSIEPAARRGIVVAVAVVVLAQVVDVPVLVSDEAGLDYQREPLLEDIERQLAVLDPSVPIYSDRADLVWWATGRPAGNMPVAWHGTSELPNAELAAEIDRLHASGRRYLVYFGEVPGAHLPARPNFVTDDDVVSEGPATEITADGVADLYQLGS